MYEAHGSRWLFRAFGSLLLFASGISLGNGPTPFSCPPGTQPEWHPHPEEPAQVETCRDSKTGFREGPFREIAQNGRVIQVGSFLADKLHGEARIYDAKGRLTHVIQYSNGEEVGTRLTRAGMENSFRVLNERFRKNGEKLRVLARDEQTVEIINATSTRFNHPERDEKAMRERLVAEGSTCVMFTSYSNIQFIIARYVDDAGKELLVVPLQRADCGK